MKTYIHYLWHKLKDVWDNDYTKVLAYVWLLIGFGLLYSSIPMCFFSESIAIVLAIVGLLTLALPLPLLWIIGKIQNELSNYENWKKSDGCD